MNIAGAIVDDVFIESYDTATLESSSDNIDVRNLVLVSRLAGSIEKIVCEHAKIIVKKEKRGIA